MPPIYFRWNWTERKLCLIIFGFATLSYWLINGFSFDRFFLQYGTTPFYYPSWVIIIFLSSIINLIVFIKRQPKGIDYTETSLTILLASNITIIVTTVYMLFTLVIVSVIDVISGIINSIFFEEAMPEASLMGPFTLVILSAIVLFLLVATATAWAKDLDHIYKQKGIKD